METEINVLRQHEQQLNSTITKLENKCSTYVLTFGVSYCIDTKLKKACFENLLPLYSLDYIPPYLLQKIYSLTLQVLNKQ